MRKPKNYIIYDVITRQNISIEIGSIVKTCEKLGFDSTTLPKLNIKTQISDRYILPEAKDRIFTLVDIETGKEYDCITNTTIFIHLDTDYSDNDAKYVYELKKGKQGKASICGKLFYLKNGRTSKTTSQTKVVPDVIKNELQVFKFKKTIRLRMQARLSSALAGKNKSSRTQELIGCDIDLLKKYLEGKFTNFMGWHNRNLWHIDHIKPCVFFNLENPEEQKKCFHYTNLQPIWKSTKVAKKMGEIEYIGNYNKNSVGLQYDYYMADQLCKNFPEMSKFEAKLLSVKLFNSGIRKILPEHLHLY